MDKYDLLNLIANTYGQSLTQNHYTNEVNQEIKNRKNNKEPKKENNKSRESKEISVKIKYNDNQKPNNSDDLLLVVSSDDKNQSINDTTILKDKEKKSNQGNQSINRMSHNLNNLNNLNIVMSDGSYFIEKKYRNSILSFIYKNESEKLINYLASENKFKKLKNNLFNYLFDFVSADIIFEIVITTRNKRFAKLAKYRNIPIIIEVLTSRKYYYTNDTIISLIKKVLLIPMYDVYIRALTRLFERDNEKAAFVTYNLDYRYTELIKEQKIDTVRLNNFLLVLNSLNRINVFFNPLEVDEIIKNLSTKSELMLKEFEKIKEDVFKDLALFPGCLICLGLENKIDQRLGFKILTVSNKFECDICLSTHIYRIYQLRKIKFGCYHCAIQQKNV